MELKILIKVVLVSFIAFFLISGVAYSGFTNMDSGYVGLQYGSLKYDVKSLPEDSRPGSIMGKAGYFIFNQIALEGRFGIGLRSDSVVLPDPDDEDATLSGDLELDRLFGGYAAGFLPLGGFGSVYGLVGASNARIKYSVDGFSSSDSRAGVSFGFGGNIHIGHLTSIDLDDFWSVNLEYMRYLNKSNYKLDAFSIGIGFHW